MATKFGTHMYADRSGNGSKVKNAPHPRGDFWGSTIQRYGTGKCHELARKSIHFKNPITPHGWGGVLGLKFKSRP